MNATEQIRKALADGKQVYSFACGRVGRITGFLTEDPADCGVRIKFARGSGVTSFNGGDLVEVVEIDGKVVVQNPEWVWDPEARIEMAEITPVAQINQIAKTRRPTRLDEDGYLRVATKINPRIQDWLGADADKTTEEQNLTIKGLAEAIEECYAFSYDAYKIASYLEDSSGYAADASLVSALGSVVWRVQEEEAAMEASWVRENNIQPDFKAGDLVQFRDSKGVARGEVIEVDKERARYHIFSAERGHVRLSGNETGVAAVIIGFEQVSVIV